MARENPVKKLARGAFALFGLQVSKRPPLSRSANPWLRNHGIGTVLDIGANTGQFATYILGAIPGVKVYSFEPLRDCYEEITRLFAGRPEVTALNFAVGDQNGSSTIHRSEYSPSSSLLAMGDLHKEAFPHTRTTTTEEIQVRRLDDVGEIDIVGNLLVKMDVQGFEDRVIAGGRETLSKAVVVISEVSFFPLYEGQALFDDVYRSLRELGFTYHGSLGSKRDPRDGKVLDEDAVFVRDAS